MLRISTIAHSHSVECVNENTQFDMVPITFTYKRTFTYTYGCYHLVFINKFVIAAHNYLYTFVDIQSEASLMLRHTKY